MKNYGVENPFQSEEVKDKSKATCLENYGIEYSLQSQEVITSLKIYSFLKKQIDYTKKYQYLKYIILIKIFFDISTYLEYYSYIIYNI